MKLKRWITIILTGGMLLSLGGCGGMGESASMQKYVEALQSTTTAVMHTSMGDITISLFPDRAPKTVANFVELAKKDYYNGVTFHRVISDFMIQSGDPTGTGSGGDSIYGGYFEDEFSEELFNFRGSLSMANTGNVDTNSSQFFIVQNKGLESKWIEAMKNAGYPEAVWKIYQENGGAPYLDFKHTVFGYVTEGMDVVDKIAAVETNKDKPIESVIINSIDITEK